MTLRTIRNKSLFLAFAIALVAVAASSRNADASRYAIAWDGAKPRCSNNAGNECDEPET